MSTRHRIDEALYSEPMGDVEKYFQNLVTMIEANSGVHDFKLITSDCYNVNAPFKADRFATFQLTDRAVDIVDISKGFINLKCEIDLQFLFKNLNSSADGQVRDITAFFIGFKSASHIINNYNIISNGRLTACKNTKSKAEQMITYSSKAKEERAGRPGMYSPHDRVRSMDDCVAGTYVILPPFADKNTIKTVTIDLVIQIDDLLPLSAMSYFPRFIAKDLELQISCNLLQNMVFCQIPFNSVIDHKIEAAEQDLLLLKVLPQGHMDSRFHQCGDYARCLVGYKDSSSNAEFTNTDLTIVPSNLNVLEAKSFIYGFNIKEDCKNRLYREFDSNNFIVPAQWIEHYTLSQLPTRNNIRSNIQVPMFNCCQAIMTFPNSGNQLTVSRNPHLDAVQCHISDRIIPDKFFKTTDRTHCEMTLANLNMDSLFTAPDEIIEALTRDRKGYDVWTLKKIDDSDYMLVFNLERFGNGCFCDGMSGNPVPINLTANLMYDTKNPHYYDDEGNFTAQNINLFIVQDAFWVFGHEGGEFIKDASNVY